MSAKLAAVDDSDEKSRMSEDVETKIMALQSKLREVRSKNKKEAPVSPAVTSNPNTESVNSGKPNRLMVSNSIRHGGRPGGGRFSDRGRFETGRGRFSRGGNISVDYRPKTLIVRNIPEGFEVEQHLGRCVVLFSRHFYLCHMILLSLV